MISIFIRTYEGDIEWLRYCLLSIHRNLVGWDEIVICIPKGQESKLAGLITTERVVLSPNYKDDYIGQQISKLQSYRHIRGDFVLFVDSDLIFHPGADVAGYFHDGKPVILKESYDRLVARHPKLKMADGRRQLLRSSTKSRTTNTCAVPHNCSTEPPWKIYTKLFPDSKPTQSASPNGFFPNSISSAFMWRNMKPVITP